MAIHHVDGRDLIICIRRVVWKDRAGRIFRWLDADGQPVETGAYRRRISDSLGAPEPALMDTLTDAARKASSWVPLPFVRVDLYHTHRGVVGGELPPYPGAADKFSAEWHERLTAAWHEAAQRLTQGIQDGVKAEVIAAQKSIMSDTKPYWGTWRSMLWRRRIRLARMCNMRRRA